MASASGYDAAKACAAPALGGEAPGALAQPNLRAGLEAWVEAQRLFGEDAEEAGVREGILC